MKKIAMNWACFVGKRAKPMNIWLFTTAAVALTAFGILNYNDSKDSMDLYLLILIVVALLQGLEVYGLREKIKKLEESRQSKVGDI